VQKKIWRVLLYFQLTAKSAFASCRLAFVFTQRSLLFLQGSMQKVQFRTGITAQDIMTQQGCAHIGKWI